MTRSLDSGVILLARIALAVLFLWGGVMKLAGYAGFVAYLHSANVPLVPIAAPLSLAVDLTGALLLILGLKVKPLAVVMAVYTMATGIFGHDFWNVRDPVMHHDMAVHFLKNVSIAGGFLLLLVTGAGQYSIDRIRAAARIRSLTCHPGMNRAG